MEGERAHRLTRSYKWGDGRPNLVKGGGEKQFYRRFGKGGDHRRRERGGKRADIEKKNLTKGGQIVFDPHKGKDDNKGNGGKENSGLTEYRHSAAAHEKD